MMPIVAPRHRPTRAVATPACFRRRRPTSTGLAMRILPSGQLSAPRAQREPRRAEAEKTPRVPTRRAAHRPPPRASSLPALAATTADLQRRMAVAQVKQKRPPPNLQLPNPAAQRLPIRKLLRVTTRLEPDLPRTVAKAAAPRGAKHRVKKSIPANCPTEPPKNFWNGSKISEFLACPGAPETSRWMSSAI